MTSELTSISRKCIFFVCIIGGVIVSKLGIFSGGKIEFKSHACFTMSHSPLPNNFSNIIIPKSHASENETVRNKFFPVGTMSLLSVFVLSVFK